MCAHVVVRVLFIYLFICFFIFFKVQRRCVRFLDNSGSPSLSCLPLHLIVRMDVFLMAGMGEADGEQELMLDGEHSHEFFIAANSICLRTSDLSWT